MADTKDKAADPEVQRIHSLSELHEKLDKLLAGGAPSSATASKDEGTVVTAPPAGSVEQQVAKAVADAKEKEERKTEAQKIDDRLRELEKRTEKPPREQRGITRFFWGSDE
jgi:hypothetical protein